MSFLVFGLKLKKVFRKVFRKVFLRCFVSTSLGFGCQEKRRGFFSCGPFGGVVFVSVFCCSGCACLPQGKQGKAFAPEALQAFRKESLQPLGNKGKARSQAKPREARARLPQSQASGWPAFEAKQTQSKANKATEHARNKQRVFIRFVGLWVCGFVSLPKVGKEGESLAPFGAKLPAFLPFPRLPQGQRLAPSVALQSKPLLPLPLSKRLFRNYAFPSDQYRFRGVSNLE